MIHVLIEGRCYESRMQLPERSLRQRIKALKEIQRLQERFPAARITAISSKLAKKLGRVL